MLSTQEDSCISGYHVHHGLLYPTIREILITACERKPTQSICHGCPLQEEMCCVITQQIHGVLIAWLLAMSKKPQVLNELNYYKPQQLHVHLNNAIKNGFWCSLHPNFASC